LAPFKFLGGDVQNVLSNTEFDSLLWDAEEKLSVDPMDLAGNVSVALLAALAGFPDLARHNQEKVAHIDKTGVASVKLDEKIRSLAGTEFAYPYLVGSMAYFAGDVERAADILESVARESLEGNRVLHAARAMIAASRSDRDIATLLASSLTVSTGRVAERVAALSGFLERYPEITNEATAARICDAVIQDPTRSANQQLINEVATAREQDLFERTMKLDTYLAADFMLSEWHRTYDVLATTNKYEHQITYYHDLHRTLVQRMIDDHGIKRVVNFGVLCAETDAKLALANPTIQFIGVDRDERVCRQNTATYPLPNLTFHAAEIIDVIASLKSEEPTMLTHLRTAYLVYHNKLEAIYAECARRGVKAVLGIEQWGISCETRRMRVAPDGWAAYRDILFMHDYARFLSEAGYAVESSELIPFPLLWSNSCFRDTHTYAVAAVAHGAANC
jgi:hypothetical protein